MTRDEALESGIRQAWRFLGDVCEGNENIGWAAKNAVECCWPRGATADELRGFAVGLTMVAVEITEMVRKRREAGDVDAG